MGRLAIVAASWAVVQLGCAARSPGGSTDAMSEPMAARMGAVEVVVYGTEWCPVCRRARLWLGTNGYRYRWLDVDRDVTASVRHRRLNPRGSVPTFDVNGETLIGFDPATLKRLVATAASTDGARSSDRP